MYQDIKTILFDLGNVVIYLHEEGSYHEFASLSTDSYQTLKTKVKNEKFFNEFEKGEISETEFRSGLRRLLSDESLANNQLDDAWNKMLIKIDPMIIDVIKRISESRTVMVLSNTNSIHEKAFHKMLNEVSEYTHLDQFFHKVYLSHEIRERKPDHSSWQFILNDNPDMIAAEVLFLDDKIENPGETLELLKLLI